MSITAFRIAIREEGSVIVAYVAQPTSMDNRFEVARVMRDVACNPEVWEQFKQLSVAIARHVAQASGLDLDRVVVEPAPEHERAGHA